ncbi:MAG: hypothetical protein OHK0052_16810 [Anaerolineales bacterium]
MNPQQAQEILIALFRRNGCIRVVDEERRKTQGQKYRKGYEVRFVAKSQEELATIRTALEILGFKPGKPYQKVRQFVQPVYGKTAVAMFTQE